MKLLKSIIHSLGQHLTIKTIEASKQISLFGLVMTINFPLFGLLWKIDGSPVFTIETLLRFIATCLCLLLLTHRYWPYRLTRFLPLCWYLALTFCLPFFFTYLTLEHHVATLWLMNCISAMFFLFIVANVVDALIIMIIGSGCGFILFYFIHSSPIIYIPGEISALSLTITFGAALIIGALFARDKENIQQGKLTDMRLMAGSLAHDLRTPLASIHLQTERQEHILMQLKNPQLADELRQNLDKITQGIQIGNQVISMQLNNILRERIDTKKFSLHPIKQLLQTAIQDYPVSQQQKNLIQYCDNNAFSIWTDCIGFKNLIWNLLNNSFHFIKSYNKGFVYIWFTRGQENDDFNYLHFKDTAKGLSPKSAEKIFDAMYTDRQDGTGIGLSYCKLFMQASGGEISCKGKPNHHIHFTIKFPKVD